MPLRWVVVMMMLCVQAKAHVSQHFYRAFWFPMYHGERLAYCLKDDKTCGLEVANAYCRVMKYQQAKFQLIDHNVGKTSYWDKGGQCTGWRCDGFKLIACEGQFSDTDRPAYAYRLRKFHVPRVDHYRVAWCYAEGKQCGSRAAYAFCRHMGYTKSTAYKQEKGIAATKALGDNALCFGKTCDGFESITCHR